MIIVKGVINFSVTSGTRDLHRQNEPIVKHESQKRNRGRLNQKSENGECIYVCKESIWKSVAH